MLKYTLRKLLALIPKVLMITIVVFFALELLPGDALTRTMSPHQYNELTETQRDALRDWSISVGRPYAGRFLQGIRHHAGRRPAFRRPARPMHAPAMAAETLS